MRVCRANSQESVNTQYFYEYRIFTIEGFQIEVFGKVLIVSWSESVQQYLIQIQLDWHFTFIFQFHDCATIKQNTILIRVWHYSKDFFTASAFKCFSSAFCYHGWSIHIDSCTIEYCSSMCNFEFSLFFGNPCLPVFIMTVPQVNALVPMSRWRVDCALNFRSDLIPALAPQPHITRHDCVYGFQEHITLIHNIFVETQPQSGILLGGHDSGWERAIDAKLIRKHLLFAVDFEAQIAVFDADVVPRKGGTCLEFDQQSALLALEWKFKQFGIFYGHLEMQVNDI